MEEKNKNDLNEEELEQISGGTGGRAAHKSDKTCPQCGATLYFDIVPRISVKYYICRECGWSGNQP